MCDESVRKRDVSSRDANSENLYRFGPIYVNKRSCSKVSNITKL